MASQRDERFYSSSIGKQRRSPPAGDTGGFFPTGQGGRTVLPPLSSAFPTTSRFSVPQSFSNQYAQPRSSPGRYDYSNQAMYNQWPTAGAPQTTSYNYEYTDPRYTLQSTYSSYPSRTSPTIPEIPPDSRRLAPLQTGRDDKQWQASYSTMPSNSHIRSPTASYPNQYYSSEQGHSYSYPNMPINHPHHVSSMAQSHASSVAQSRLEPRATSPFNRGGPSDSSQQPYAAPPVSPTTDEPMIKKKRKRADASQLKVLNDVYSRTAFPSTEERLSLAKQLDMSPRSVQIWFQNKRQSMRQTNRQSSTLHQSFSIAPGQEPVDEMLHNQNLGYGSSTMSVAGSSYGMQRSSPDSNRSVMHSTSPSIPPRRPGSSGGAVDSRKWGTYC